MSRMIDDEEALKDNGLIEVDGCNVAEERKILIHTDKYSIGEDGLIEGEIPFTDICYDLALQLQRAKAELEQYKIKVPIVDCYVCKNFQENKVLKAENEKLKDNLSDAEAIILTYQTELKELYKSNDKLQAKNEKMKSMINMHLTTFDKCCVNGLIMSNNMSEVLNLRATDKIEFKQYYKAENERLKQALEDIRNECTKPLNEKFSLNDFLNAKDEELTEVGIIQKNILKIINEVLNLISQNRR